MSSWTKEMRVRVWDLKGKEGNSQKDDKEQVFVHKCLLGHTETMGHRILPDFAGFLPVYHTSFILYCAVLSHSAVSSSLRSHGL